jgi:hypothetical protein
VDEHRYHILITFVFFVAISQVEKIDILSIIHKQARKFNKKGGNEEVKYIGFGLRFILIL